MMVEALEHSIVPQLREPSVNRAPRRKAVGQEPPRTARPQHVEDRLDDLPHRPTSSPATSSGRRKLRLDQPPLSVGKIASIAQARASMLRAGRRVPHSLTQLKVRNPLESARSPLLHSSLPLRLDTPSTPHAATCRPP